MVGCTPRVNGYCPGKPIRADVSLRRRAGRRVRAECRRVFETRALRSGNFLSDGLEDFFLPGAPGFRELCGHGILREEVWRDFCRRLPEVPAGEFSKVNSTNVRLVLVFSAPGRCPCTRSAAPGSRPGSSSRQSARSPPGPGLPARRKSRRGARRASPERSPDGIPRGTFRNGRRAEPQRCEDLRASSRGPRR